MKLVCISDTHGKHRQLDLPPGDVLIHAGDWTGGQDIAFVETEDFLSWFEDQPHEHKILIAGNHEVTVERQYKFFTELLESYPSITYLHNSETVINGIKFYGSPYSNEFYNWAFMEHEFKLQDIWDMIPDDTNVLITHGPAYGCNDRVNNHHGADPHVGSQSLHYRKLELGNSLKAHISGHIHEAYGITTTGDILNICASILNEHYKLVNKPIVVDI